MTTETTRIRYYVIEVARNLPLSEQLHYANDILCLEALSNERCFLEKIEASDSRITLTYHIRQKI